MAKKKPMVTKKVTGLKPAKAAPPSSTADKRASFQEQIDALEAQKADLEKEYIAELKLKLSDAKKVVSELEEEMANLTGKPAGTKVRRERRPSIDDASLQDQLLKVMATHGKEGMNAKQLGERLHQDALRIRKFITANPKVLKRQGAGPGTKFFLQ